MVRPGPPDYPVALGQKHAHPFIEDGVAHLHDAGLPTVVGVALAAPWATLGIARLHDGLVRGLIGRASDADLAARLVVLDGGRFVDVEVP